MKAIKNLVRNVIIFTGDEKNDQKVMKTVESVIIRYRNFHKN